MPLLETSTPIAAAWTTHDQPPKKLPLRLGEDLPNERQPLPSPGITPVSAALGFVLAHPEIHVSIVGVTSAAELTEVTTQAISAPLDLPWTSFAVNDAFVLSPFLWTSKDPSGI